MSRRKHIIALLAGAILVAGIAGTLAWLSATGVLVNQFGIGSVTPSVQETLSGNVKSDVKAKNMGTAPAYIRAAVDIYWQDATSGARLWKEPQADTDSQANPDYKIVWSDSLRDASGVNSASSWVKASDGFYYWTSRVTPGEETGALIKSVTELNRVEGRNLVVDVSTQAVQSAPDEAVHEAWGCTVQDGVLIPPYANGGA